MNQVKVTALIPQELYNILRHNANQSGVSLKVLAGNMLMHGVQDVIAKHKEHENAER